VSSKRKLKKRASIAESIEEKRRKLFQSHPLWVQWQVQSKSEYMVFKLGISLSACSQIENSLISDGESCVVHFTYFVKLKIITVKTKAYPTPLKCLTE